MFKRLKLWQRGQVLVFTALLLPVMLVILVCALNAGILYVEYTRLQNAADSAALAGATTYAEYFRNDRRGATILTRPSLQSDAKKEAVKAMKKSVEVNLPNTGTTTDGSAIDVSINKSTEHYNATATVELTETIPLLVFGDYDIKVKAEAVQPFDEKIGWFIIPYVDSRKYAIADSRLNQ